MINNTYKNHRIFSQLSQYAGFYKDLSLSVMGFISMGVKGVLNIDTYVYSSMRGTLESIKTILMQGHISDSYALLRKYYDVSIINVYSDLYLDDHFSLENFVVEKIDMWVRGKERLPEYRVMSQYIRESSKLAGINSLLYKDDTYKKLRDRCNDYTHFNLYYAVLVNDGEIYLKGRIGILNRLSKDLEDIFILHLSYLFTLRENYMMSSDHVDSLESGLTPEEGSEYNVAPFVQEIFDSVIKKNRMDLATEIKSKTSMRLA